MYSISLNRFHTQIFFYSIYDRAHIIIISFGVYSIFAVPPAYYAHLAAFRARYYMEGETSDSGSASGGRTANFEVKLPSVKENVKDVMFFCWRLWYAFVKMGLLLWDAFCEDWGGGGIDMRLSLFLGFIVFYKHFAIFFLILVAATCKVQLYTKFS